MPPAFRFRINLAPPGLAEAASIAERIRSATENVSAEKCEIVKYTVSIGVASIIARENGGFKALIASADEALYRAKELGRNRVETA